jgi:CRISPR/Cas system CMR-associated protein Cmr5 small subunit
MLDSYSSKLDDRNVSLKNIAPVLEKIKDHAGNLLKETERLTDADANLKKIATRTIITAQTEYLKFQRGDYLS